MAPTFGDPGHEAKEKPKDKLTHSTLPPINDSVSVTHRVTFRLAPTLRETLMAGTTQRHLFSLRVLTQGQLSGFPTIAGVRLSSMGTILEL